MSNLITSLRLGARSLCKALLRHPAAVVMLLYCFVVVLVEDAGKWENPAYLAPVCIVLSLAIDYLLEGKPRFEGKPCFEDKPRFEGKPHWSLLVLPLFAALAFFDFEESLAYWIITLVVTPLGILLYRRNFRDGDFIRHAIWVVWSAALSLAIAAVVCLLLVGICHSVDTLFGTDLLNKIENFLVAFPFVLLCPLLFIGISEKEDVPSIRKVLEAVTNWAVSPALVIYSAVLLAYIVKIIFSWSLPCGGVAVMCFVWGLVAFFVTSVQPLFERHPFAWFRKAYGWLSVPFVILLWVSIARRVGEYGVTPPRYYLILCGVLMTVYIAISLFRKDGLYYKITAIAAALFLLSASVPGISYESVTVASQIRRARNYAEKLGLLAEDGKRLLEPSGSIDDSGTFYDLKESLEVIRKYDEDALSRLGGLSYDGYDVHSKNEYDRITVSDDEDVPSYPAGGFTTLQFDCCGHWLEDEGDVVEIAGRKVNCQQLFEEKLKSLDAPEPVTAGFLTDHASELLVWDTGDMRIFLEEMDVKVFASAKSPQLVSFRPRAVLTGGGMQ